MVSARDIAAPPSAGFLLDQCYNSSSSTYPMSEEQLKAFLEKVQGDTSLQDKLKEAAADNTVDIKAVAEIAQEAGFNITREGIKEFIDKAANPTTIEELSDEALQGVSGGAISFDVNRFFEKSVPDGYNWLKGHF